MWPFQIDKILDCITSKAKNSTFQITFLVIHFKTKSLRPFQVYKILDCTFAMMFTFSVIYKFSHAWKIVYSKIQKLSGIKSYLKID